MKKIALSLMLMNSLLLTAQTYEKISTNNTESFRGLSFEDAQTFVFSGTNNTIGKSVDGGKTIQWININFDAKHDFRDIEVLGKKHYLAMGIDSPAYLFETKDGGKTWAKVYENSTKGIFLDAMYFDKKTKNIYVLGDPLDGKIPLVLQSNLKNTQEWTQVKKLNQQYLRLADPKEAFFAASGSNLYADDQQILIASGGSASLLYRYTNKEVQGYQIDKTKSTTAGIYGMDFSPKLNLGFLVGGDYTKPNESDNNFYKFKIENNKVKFVDMYSIPKGYLSSVSIIDQNKFIVCGPNGIQYTTDHGVNWETLTTDAYNTCQVSPDKKFVILVGPKGNVGKIIL